MMRIRTNPKSCRPSGGRHVLNAFDGLPRLFGFEDNIAPEQIGPSEHSSTRFQLPPMTHGHEIAIALRAAYLALHRRTEASLAPSGVTADQFVLMATLSRGGRALTQRELAHRMSSDPSTVRAMLVLMERRGLIARDAHPSDARARTVALTAKGQRTLRRLWADGEPIRAQMLGALAQDDAAALVALLTQIAQALNPESAVAQLLTSHSPEDEV